MRRSAIQIGISVTGQNNNCPAVISATITLRTEYPGISIFSGFFCRRKKWEAYLVQFQREMS